MNYLVKVSPPKEKSLENVMKRVKKIVEEIPNKAYFHVL